MTVRPVTITVSGTAMAGKSAVAELIRQAMKQHGLSVELIDDNGIGVVDEAPGVIEQTLEARLTRLRALNTPISVHTKHAVRMSK